MKVKEFLEDFKDYDPESELKIELFEEIMNSYVDYEEIHSPLEVGNVEYLDESDTVFVTLQWGTGND